MKLKFKEMILLCASFIVLTACSSMNKPEAVTHDGLELESTKPFDALYKKPGIDLQQYNSFMISECSMFYPKLINRKV